MAQPGNFTPILLYGSSTPGNAPVAANLTNSATGSEIAINVADKNLFFKDSTNAVNTVPIRQSNTSSNGWLSSTDWNTFNNKSNTNGTVTSVAALTLGTTGTDLSSTVANGTTTPVITLQVPTASATNRGALSSTDWSTFNGKQTALVSGTNIKTVSGVSLLGSGDVGTIGTGYGGTGLTSFTATGIVYASSTSALATSANLVFDGTNVGIGVTLSAWAIGRALSVGKAGSFYGDGIDVGWKTGLAANAYRTATSTWKYANSGVPATLFESDDAAFSWQSAAAGTAGNNITFTDRMRIDNAGNICFQGSTNSSTAFVTYISTDGATTSRLSIGGSASSGSTGISLYSTGAGAFRFYVNYAGQIFATSTSISAISDESLKENIKDIDTGLNSIMALKPRRFDWKDGKGQNKKNAAGFIAQEFESVFPECVSTSMAGADGIEYKNINHETLIPTLVKAIQELNNKFDAYVASHP